MNDGISFANFKVRFLNTILYFCYVKCGVAESRSIKTDAKGDGTHYYYHQKISILVIYM